MGFIFHPTILRVEQPNLILNELRHFKIQLDHSPLMDALFSPATVPMPPSSIPWPSNYVNQRYLPPNDLLKTQEPQDLRRILNSPNSIQQSIQESIARNSALFSSVFPFQFPAMPDFSKSIDGLVKTELDKINVILNF